MKLSQMGLEFLSSISAKLIVAVHQTCNFGLNNGIFSVVTLIKLFLTFSQSLCSGFPFSL